MEIPSLEHLTSANNWVDLLGAQADRFGDRQVFTFLDENGDEADSLTLRELDGRARAIAQTLRGRVQPGDRALLLYPAGLDYVAAFYGCLYAGVIAVPMFAPDRSRFGYIELIAADCAPAIVLTTDQAATALDGHTKGWSLDALPWLMTDALSPVLASGDAVVCAEAGAVGYLQYTSGSTAAIPKGAMIDHAMSLRNCLEVTHAWEVDADSVVVSWLPHFHDFGQIVSALLPVYLGCTTVLMAPSTFVKNPIRWLDAITDYGGTHSGGPNFAYDLCVDTTNPRQRDGIDLRTWRMVCNAGEPARARTMERFQKTFEPYGLPVAAQAVAYGMAEATSKITCSAARQVRTVKSFDSVDLGLRRARPVVGMNGDGVTLVGVGTATPGTEIAIVEPESGRRLGCDEVGEIWVSGPSISRSYWNRPTETADAFGAQLADATSDVQWLRTGDVGFVHQDELFVCGRLKNRMIAHGVSYYLEDIEDTVVGSDDAVRAGNVLAFGVPQGEHEQLVLVVACRADNALALDRLASVMHAAVVERHRISPNAIVFVTPGTVTRTTSGKLRRQQCRDDFLGNRLTEILRWTASESTVASQIADAHEPVAAR